MRWFKGAAGQPGDEGAVVSDRGEMTSDLKMERLRRAIIDFPGRVDSDLARIIYGRDEASLVAASGRKLEADGMVTRDPESGRMYACRS